MDVGPDNVLPDNPIGAIGYADLDCDNPAQDVISSVRHGFPIILRRIGGIVAIYFHIIAVGPVATFDMPQTLSTPRETSQSNPAERLWEQAITAKGGREALYGVRNLFVSSRRDYPSRRLKKNQLRHEVLYVLPHKFWSWSDYRPDVFGLRIEMYDYERSTKYVISELYANGATLREVRQAIPG